MPSPFRDNGKFVEALKTGDNKAVEYFFGRYFHGLKIHVGMDDDLAMEAFETALEKIALYNPEKGKFSTWVYRIAENLMLKKKEKDSKMPVLYAEDYLTNYDEDETGGDDREEWLKPGLETEQSIYSNFFQTNYINSAFTNIVNKAMKMLSVGERKILKDYCEKKRTRYSPGVRKKVFKHFRQLLLQIEEHEERQSKLRLSYTAK